MTTRNQSNHARPEGSSDRPESAVAVAEPTQAGSARDGAAAWKTIVAKFQQSCPKRAGWQLASTVGAYAAVWALMYFTVAVSAWLTVPLVLLAGGLLIRIFIIFHDCGHGSFLPSRAANDLVGAVTGLLTFTPYRAWRGEHAVHHGATGDLDRRGIGDIWTMTVKEYLAATPGRRFVYRVVRHPLVLFVVAPFYLFVIQQRWPRRSAPARERWSVWGTNLALVGLFAVMGSIFGLLTFLVLQLTTLVIAGAIGIWLFYLQHQFEDAYWERGERWDYAAAALKGSSFLALPKILQWFSGNIGFHHIHHLSPRIPNYFLERCHVSDPLFQQVRPMTLRSSWNSLRLRLWDEASQKLISFRHLRQIRARS
jgi:omega-6 fatty acid desaturase (delta-12 desaturase)